jgi:hypothetical protein
MWLKGEDARFSTPEVAVWCGGLLGGRSLGRGGVSLACTGGER